MEVDRIFALQQANRKRLRESTAAERINKLGRIKTAIEKRLVELNAAVYQDLRRPEPEVLLSEVYPVVTEIRHARRHLEDWLKPISVPSPLVLFNARSEVRYEPKGVVLIIAPWNFPFQLSVAPLVSALAAGNAAIIKPSELAPRTAAFTRSLLSELFDENEVAVVEGDHRVAQSLVRQPFDHIFFTGSPRVGREVMAAAATQLASVTLELGGKSPVIVDSSADIGDAAHKILWGKCFNAGQSCVAPDYVLVPKDLEPRFIELARDALERRYGPVDSLAENPDYGRIVNEHHFRRVKRLVDAALQDGARIEAGGIFREEDCFISPTLLSDVLPSSDIMREEIFGPVLPILTYETREQAITLVNSLPRPLALYVFGKNPRVVEGLLGEIGAGGSVVNDVVVHFSNPYLPFGGFNHSGIGKSHGYFGFKAFSHERGVMHQPKRSLARLLYPPYRRSVRKLIHLIVRFF